MRIDDGAYKEDCRYIFRPVREHGIRSMKTSSLYDVPRVLSGGLALLVVAFVMHKAVRALFVARARQLVR